MESNLKNIHNKLKVEIQKIYLKKLNFLQIYKKIDSSNKLIGIIK